MTENKNDDNNKRGNQPQQMYQKAEELRREIGRKKNLYYDSEAWTNHQELLNIYQRLLLIDIGYALDKKVEVDLWNYCFKDYISHLQAASRDKSALKKKSANEAHVILTWFLDMASGFYLVLMQEIKTKYELSFPFLPSDAEYGITPPQKDEQHPVVKEKFKNDNLKNCIYLAQHCMVHLGDIARYRNRIRQAESFYRQALQIAPGSGQSYNQIALIEAGRGDKLSATFYYVRALALGFPFPAAATNLEKLFSKIEDDRESMPVKETKLNGQTFIPYFLRFISLLHHARHLKTAAKICHLLGESITSIVATHQAGEGHLTSWNLIQVTSIAIFVNHNNNESSKSADEEEITRLLCEFMAALLNAILLPIYTLVQGQKLLDYFALPATKLILDWIVLNPRLIDQKGFLKRLQIWPSLCRMLNELSELLLQHKEYLDEEKVPENYPLPVDFDLQAFLPLGDKLKRYNFRQVTSHTIDEKNTKFLRAQRLTEVGLELASENFCGRRVMKAETFSDLDQPGKYLFQAVEQKISPELLREFNDLKLDSSSEEESDVEKEVCQLIFKEDDAEDIPHVEESLVKKPAIKTKNVAMAAIMRKAMNNQTSIARNDETNPSVSKVSFKSPSPCNSNSQDSINMSQELNYDNNKSKGSLFLSTGAPIRPNLTVPPPTRAQQTTARVPRPLDQMLSFSSNRGPRPLEQMQFSSNRGPRPLEQMQYSSNRPTMLTRGPRPLSDLPMYRLRSLNQQQMRTDQNWPTSSSVWNNLDSTQQQQQNFRHPRMAQDLSRSNHFPHVMNQHYPLRSSNSNFPAFNQEHSSGKSNAFNHRQNFPNNSLPPQQPQQKLHNQNLEQDSSNYTDHLRNLVRPAGADPSAVTAATANAGLQGQGPNLYSLFSNPNIGPGNAYQQQQQQQHGNHHHGGNIFHSGTSALEQLLQQQRREH